MPRRQRDIDVRRSATEYSKDLRTCAFHEDYPEAFTYLLYQGKERLAIDGKWRTIQRRSRHPQRSVITGSAGHRGFQHVDKGARLGRHQTAAREYCPGRV